jgi:hypothetical protein
MGVKANLNGITFTTGGKNQALIAGVDLPGMIAECALAIAEIQAKLNYLILDVLTPSGTEGSNITTINTQLTSLA